MNGRSAIVPDFVFFSFRRCFVLCVRLVQLVHGSNKPNLKSCQSLFLLKYGITYSLIRNCPLAIRRLSMIP